MMATMRKLINNKVYKFVLWIFLFMMAAGSGMVINRGMEKKWVIKVYDEILLHSKFESVLKTERAQKAHYKQKGIVLSEKNIEKDAIKSSVASLLNEHVLSTTNIAIPDNVVDKEINKQLSQLPPQFFNPNHTLNRELLARQISPLTIEDFFDELKKATQSNLLYSIIEASAYVPTFEKDLYQTIEFAKKDYSIIKFPLSKYISKAKETIPTDQALEKFYKNPKNNESFKTEEQRAGVLWRFNEKDYNISVTDNDVKKDYEKNKNKHLIEPSQMQVRRLLVSTENGNDSFAKEKIEKLEKQAKESPENFINLVKEFSDDKDAKKTDGLTKLFSQQSSELDSNIINTAFESLTLDGQISLPIKTNRGYEILQRVQKIPAKYKELKSVSDEIRKNLISTKFKQRFTQDANRAITGARYNPEAFEKFITKGDKSSIKLTTNTGNAEITNLFKTEEGRYSTFFDKNDGIIVQCTTIEKSKIPNISEIKGSVITKYHEKEGTILLEKALSEALNKVKNGESMENVAKEFDAKLENAQAEFKNNKMEQSPILNNKQVQSKLKSLLAKGALTSVITDQNGLIIKLNNVEKLNNEEFSKENKQFVKTLLYAKKYAVRDGFIASLYRHAKIDNKIEMKQEVLQFLKEA